MTELKEKCVEDVVKGLEELTLLSFRKVDEVKRLAKHLRYVISHPITQGNPVVLRYLTNLDDTHRKVFLSQREGVEVEYIFTEKKSSVQRQRFNSLPVSEVPELLKAELQSAPDARQVHICTDCDVEIELNDEEPLMESLQKHFNLEVHLPKLKRESIDVSEPVALPNMSRRLSSMECGEPSQHVDHIIQLIKPTEKLDRMFVSKLETSLIYHLPDSSEASIDAAIKYYQTVYDKLCRDVANIDFTTQTSSVAPIIMSIKDNVNQNFAADANKNFENDENDQPQERPVKNQVKKYRYYGHIESIILEFLGHHMLLSLVDDRTGKLAFFCMACEFYTLRFRYDSVLNHVFGQTHIHNLSAIMAADSHIPLANEGATTDKIKNFNRRFLFYHGVDADGTGLSCSTCKCNIDSPDAVVNHILDENHLARLSDKFYRKMKANKPDAQAPEKWGPKSLDWAKFLASVGKPLHNNKDHVVIENFIKPSGKIANYCTCCDMTLKGLRQVLFNHIRQKKHLRNSAPFKLNLLYKNHCRPAEYYASFGNYYVCAICPQFIAVPSFAAIVDHFDSALHVETIAKLIRSALFPEQADLSLLELNRVRTDGAVHCDMCEVDLEDLSEAVNHILSIEHQNVAVEAKTKENKGDIISVYMGGNYILHSEGATFTCIVCTSVFNSIRSLLAHLVFADHFAQKPSPENVFRFYLELKHNVNMLARNKYEYYEFGKLKCGVCDADIEEGENAKRHVVSARHRENMGASYVNVSMDVSAVE